MAGRRSGDSASPPRSKPSHVRSRRSQSSSLSRSPVRLASPSPSPRTKRLRLAQAAKVRGGNDREVDRPRDRDHEKRYRDRGRERDSDKGRERDYERGSERDRDRDRGRDVERDRDRVRDFERGRERDRDKEGLSRERSRDRRVRDRHSPSISRHPMSASPRSARERRSHSSPRRKITSPLSSHRSLDRDQDRRKSKKAVGAVRDEDMNEGGMDNARVNGEEDSVAKMKAAEAALKAKQKDKEKPSFEYSGKLAAETNKVRGVALMFTEPPEARKPTIRWRLYIFKDGEPLNDPLYIHRQSCYLFGRERRVADVPTDHPSCSKQHAVIQYRLTEKEEADDTVSSQVRPYLMDLGSTNGTILNGERLEPQRYYELYEKDTIRFGNSSREYVLLHEHSAG